MQVLVGQRGVIGRFGGDEYVILLEKVETREQLKTLLKTIAKEFALAFDPKTHVTASIGVSEYPVDGSEYEELMRKADKALYLAKEKGKNRHIIYEERLHGKLESDDMQNMAMAYAVSKEKKREVITKMITELCVSGVNSIVKKEERLQEIDFTVVDDDEIPEELKTIIDQKKTGEFKLTYADQDELYIVVGYGKQLTGGYSIQFPDVYLTKENIVVTSVLLGPEGEEPANISYPYLSLIHI